MPRRSPALDPAAVVAALSAGSGDDVEGAVLDATADLMAAYGVRRWSMEDVAARSGLGRSTVYRRFEGRDELLHAVMARDARRFFTAIADAVGDIDSLEEKVVWGFLVGLRAVRRSLLPRLIETDPGAALALITAEPVPTVARQTLVERYLAMVPDGERARAELVAEALVRLALSFILLPTSVIDLDDEAGALHALRQLLVPLLR